MGVTHKVVSGGGGLGQAAVDARIDALVPAANRHCIHFDTVTVADDDVFIYQFPSDGNVGQIIVSGNVTGPRGMLAFRANTSFSFCDLIAGSDVNGYNTALTGTTGTDGDINVGATTDWKLYFENRSGGSRVLYITIFCESDGAPA